MEWMRLLMVGSDDFMEWMRWLWLVVMFFLWIIFELLYCYNIGLEIFLGSIFYTFFHSLLTRVCPCAPQPGTSATPGTWYQVTRHGINMIKSTSHRSKWKQLNQPEPTWTNLNSNNLSTTYPRSVVVETVTSLVPSRWALGSTSHDSAQCGPAAAASWEPFCTETNDM